MGSNATTAGFVVVAALLVVLVAFRQGDPGTHQRHHQHPQHARTSDGNVTANFTFRSGSSFPGTAVAPTAAPQEPAGAESPPATESGENSQESLDRACREAYASVTAGTVTSVAVTEVDVVLPLASGLAKPGDSLQQKAWWNGEKKLERHQHVPNKRIITRVRLRARAVATEFTMGNTSTAGDDAAQAKVGDFMFCPGSFKVVVTCANCRDFGPTQRITDAVLSERERRAGGGSGLHDTIDGSTLQARALSPDPLSPALSTVMAVAEEAKAPQVAFTQALADAGFGPDGFVASLHGPQRTCALGLWHAAARSANGTTGDDEFEAVLTVDAAPAAPYPVVAHFALDVLHVWSGWTHLLQLPRYGLTRPLHLLKDTRLSLRVLLPGRGESQAPSSCDSVGTGQPAPTAVRRMRGVWHRFDTVPPDTALTPMIAHASNASAVNGTAAEFTDPPAAPVVSVFPYLSGQQMTHTMPWLPGRHAFVSACPARRSPSTEDNVPPPHRGCHADGRRGSTPPLQCAVRRRIWGLLNGKGAGGRPAFDGRAFLFIGESQASQLSRQMETIVDGDLTAEALAVPPELKLRPTVRTSNGQPVPYSHGYVPGEKRTALRVYSSAPVSKIGLDRAHGGNTTNAGGSIRANFFDFNDRFDMNVSAIDPAWLKADYAVVMFCQFLVIRGVPIDEYEVRFARYLLALHGLGPDGHRVAHALGKNAIVALATCPPIAMHNPMVLSHATPDYYRIRFRDHRNHYSLRLFGLAAMRVGRFVNRQLANHGRPPMLLIDHFDAFLPLAESTYDGDHWFGSDANLAVAENLLTELLNERRRRDV